MTLCETSEGALELTEPRAKPFPQAAQDRTALELCPWLAKHARGRPRPGFVYRDAKRAIDIGVVLALAPIWIPLYALSALAVKVQDPRAPVHFAQPRTGQGGRRFRVLKLRTMVRNADELKASLRHLNIRTWPDFKLENDPRITPVGRFLRESSLDELPQMVNVLRGDMTLVGPRPTTLAPAGYEQWQLERFDVRSGVTGLWQIVGRGSPSFLERLRLDLAYVDRQCFLLDLEILARTLPAIVLRRGAC